jgi:hypothetical protein
MILSSRQARGSNLDSAYFQWLCINVDVI